MSEKAGEPIRKLTPILVARDYLNRLLWGYEQYRTYQNPDALKNILPKINWFWETYFKDEEHPLFKELAEGIVHKAWELMDQGEAVKIEVNGKKLDKRYMFIEDMVEDIKKL